MVPAHIDAQSPHPWLSKLLKPMPAKLKWQFRLKQTMRADIPWEILSTIFFFVADPWDAATVRTSFELLSWPKVDHYRIRKLIRCFPNFMSPIGAAVHQWHHVLEYHHLHTSNLQEFVCDLADFSSVVTPETLVWLEGHGVRIVATSRNAVSTAQSAAALTWMVSRARKLRLTRFLYWDPAIAERASEHGALDVLDWWQRFTPSAQSRIRQVYCSLAILRKASQLGKTNVLDWWRTSQLPIIVFRGQAPLRIEWWKRPDPANANACRIFQMINHTVIPCASRAGFPHVLDWWWRNKFPFTPYMAIPAMHEASEQGCVEVLEWWRRHVLFNNIEFMGVMELASARGHIETLEWWRQSGLHVRYQPSVLCSCFAATAIRDIGDILNPRPAQWWLKSGLPLTIDTHLGHVPLPHGDVIERFQTWLASGYHRNVFSEARVRDDPTPTLRMLPLNTLF